MKKRIILIHGNCPDGAAAAVLAQKIDPESEIIFGIHQSINEQARKAAMKVEENGDFWIVDICCDENILIECEKILRRKGSRLGVYEHHQTRSWLKSHSPVERVEAKIIYDEARCGSKIFFDAMVPLHPHLETYREFIDITNDRDLWINVDPRGLLFARLHAIYGDQEYIERFVKNTDLNITHDEQLLLDYQEKKDRRRMNRLIERIQLHRDENGYDYGVMFGEASGSDILNRAIEHHHLEYAILVNLHTARASIRSRGHFDCSAYAEKRGGGGHKCASGFKVNINLPKL